MVSHNPAISGTFLCLLMPVSSPDKRAGLRQEGIRRKTFLPDLYKCVIIVNPYRIGRGPGYQRPPQVSHSRAPKEIMLLLNKVKIRAEREEEGE